MHYLSTYKFRRDYQEPTFKSYNFEEKDLELAVTWSKRFGIILHRWEKGEIKLEQVIEKETKKVWKR